MSTIAFQNVSVAYGLEPVLDQLNFTVESGSWVSVIGPTEPANRRCSGRLSV